VDFWRLEWLNAAVKKRSGRMHVDQAGRHYTTVGGERRAYPTYLLRRSFRDEHGRPRKQTLANLTGLPEESVAALRLTLKGRTLVDAEAALEVERSVPHGDVAAAQVMASRLGLRALLGPACREGDVAYALICSRAVRPKPKLGTARWWAAGDTTLGIDLGVADASTDELYHAMDWLTSRAARGPKAAGRPAPSPRRDRDVGPVVVMGGGHPLPTGCVRALPPRQARPQAGRIRAAHRPRGPPGRRRGAGRQHRRPRVVQDRHHPGPR